MKISDFAGGGFKPSFFSGGLQIASGVNGNILTLTPPAGKKVRLTGLLCTAGETGITITADGVAVVTNQTLNLGVGSGNFAVGKSTATSSTGQAGLIDYIEGSATIVVTKVSGNTANAIQYSYAYGD